MKMTWRRVHILSHLEIGCNNKAQAGVTGKTLLSGEEVVMRKQKISWQLMVQDACGVRQ